MQREVACRLPCRPAPSPGRARIAGRRRRVIGRGRRTEQLREDRLQRVGPDLIALQRRVQLVARSSCRRTASVRVGELVVDVQEADLLAVGELREIGVDASIAGITAMLSLRGKIAVRMIVASGAFCRQTSTIARRARA